MNQKLRATTHVVGRGGVQVVGVRVALVGEHVTQSVCSLRKRANILLALARRVITARTSRSTAARFGVDISSIKSGAVKVVASLRVGVRSAGGEVESSFHKNGYRKEKDKKKVKTKL